MMPAPRPYFKKLTTEERIIIVASVAVVAAMLVGVYIITPDVPPMSKPEL